ncbi:MAG: DUF4350 domain-containing protein [Gemmataceae bacterium]
MSLQPLDVEEFDMARPSSRLWWLVPAVAFLLLVTLSMLIGKPPDSPQQGSSFSVSDDGTRAAFLVLEEVGVPLTRTRKAGGTRLGPRWMLHPKSERTKDIQECADWVRRGGRALLATNDEAFARQLGVPIRASKNAAPKTPVAAEAPDVRTLMPGEAVVEPINPSARSWGRVFQKPLVAIQSVGQGEIWLLTRPDALNNVSLHHGDNAVLTVRLAEAMRQDQPGPIEFDEFFHGLRDRPSFTELLFRPPALAVTLQALFLAALVVWHYLPRFGPAQTLPPPDRRSKEEFLDAMASLLQRNGDYDDAFRAAQADLLHRMQRALGLPAGTDAEATIAEAARRRGLRPEPYLRLLTSAGPPRGEGPLAQSFVSALRSLRVIDHEFFDARRRTR